MAVGDLHDLAVAVLGAAEQILATAIGGTPERSFVCHGLPALDCCDQLTVNVGAIGEAATAPLTALGSGQRHRSPGRVNLTTLVVTISRCYPSVADDGTPPSPTEQQAATETLNEDGWALWNGLFRQSGDLFAACDGVFFDGLVPLPPQGGCAGYVFQIRFELPGYDPGAGS